MDGKKSFAVSESSGCLDSAQKIPLQRTHFDMNRFGGPTDEEYQTVCGVITDMVDAAPGLYLARSQFNRRHQVPSSLNGIPSANHLVGSGMMVTTSPELLSVRPQTLKSKSYYTVPGKYVSRFVGRRNFIEQLQSKIITALNASDRPTVLVIQALGGQGKSQLALEYCRKSKASSRFRGIFWVDATSRTTTMRGYENIAASLNTPVTHELPDADSKREFVKEMLEKWNEWWLLVFDNYDCPDIFSDLEEFFPLNGHGAILITSRHESTQELGLSIKLTPMSEDEALELLFSKSNKQRTQESSEEGLKIVRNLGCLALAIDQAAAYINSTKLTLSQFNAKYEDQKKEILNYTPKLFWKYMRTEEDSETRKSAFTTWEMSFQQIAPAERRKRVEHFLTLSAFLNPSSIREDLFACNQENTACLLELPWMFSLRLIARNSDGDNSDRDVFDREMPVGQTPVKVFWNSGIYEELINELRELSLLENTSCDSDDTRVFSLHCLIRDWLQLRVDSKQQQNYTSEAINLVTTYLDSSFASTATLQRKQEVLAHMDTCISNNDRFLSEPGSGIGSISLKHPTTAFGIFYLRQGRYQNAETLFSRLLEDDEKHLGSVHPDTFGALENLATVYRHQSRYKEAEAYFERVLASREKEPGPEHLDTLQTVHYLAEIYHLSGRYLEAEMLYKRALAGRGGLLGLEHPETLATANSLAILYRLMGRYDESVELYKRVLASREKQLGLEQAETLSTIQGLAIVYRLQAQYDDAEILQKRALEARERVLGPEHPDTLMTVDNLACVYREKGCYDEAAELFERVWEGREKNLGPDHSSTLGTVNGLAIVRRHQRRYEEAERLHSLVLESRKKRLGHKHPKTLRTMDGLATVYQLQGRYGEAEALFEQALAGRQEKLGSEHPDTRQTAERIKNLKRTLNSPLASVKKVRSE